MTHASNMRKRTCVKTVASNKTRTVQPIFSNRSFGWPFLNCFGFHATSTRSSVWFLGLNCAVFYAFVQAF